MELGLTVGGWFASSFIDLLVDKASSYALEQYALHSGLRDDLRTLRTSLLKIRALLGTAKKRQTDDENLSELLRQLKDTAYEADDMLDEFEYRLLQQKLAARGQAGDDLLSSSLSIASRLLTTDDNPANKVMEIQMRLDSIAADIGDVIKILELDAGGEQLVVANRRETSSFLSEPDVFGRDEERDMVIELLLKPADESESSSRSVPVLPIVGVGGVGKTTLAQYVYNDYRVKEHFQLRMWVCVSDDFDVKRITREIIESASRERPEVTNLNVLQLMLKEKVALKRYLLVLDDVWDEDGSRWKSLCTPLSTGVRGSKILITTRSRKVADMVSMMDPLLLEGLPSDAYWSFFKKCAFSRGNSEEFPKLEVIAKMIADKLKGSPLAAKTLGGILSSNLDERHWRGVMNSDLWELQQDQNDVLPVLKLSYYHLPAHLKQCFAYCAIFPKDYQFHENFLVELWSALGLVKPQNNMRLEDVGSGYFHDLLSRSFFQVLSRSFFQVLWNNAYVMHDLLHDLAQYISGNECFRVVGGRSQEISTGVYHLSICTNNLEQGRLKELSKYKKLRTLVFFHGSKLDLGHTLQGLFMNLTSIRVLILRHCRIKELPDSIGNLKHLRHLNISYTGIRRLPQSLCTLYHLQVFALRRCQLESLPKGMSNLINIRQLYAEGVTISKIARIGKLTSLQELREFKVGKEDGYKIGELKDMNQLRRRLCIGNLENVQSKEEASQATLSNKEHLDQLELKWSTNEDTSLETNVPDLEVLEGLKPHPTLKKIEITRYRGVKSPSWLENQSLSSLEYVHLVNGRNLKSLPPLGHLPFLKLLYIKGMHTMKQVGGEFYGIGELKGFPSLEKLKFEDMPTWEEFASAEGTETFPRLCELSIENCPKLRELPPIPLSLTKLRLKKVGLNALPRLCDLKDSYSNDDSLAPRYDTVKSSCLSDLCIMECRKLTSLEEWLLPCYLQALQSLSISKCKELMSLPVERFKDLISLENLVIRDCPKLNIQVDVMSTLSLPSSLQKLALCSCGNLSRSLPGCLRKLTSLSALEMSDCPHIQSFPEEMLCDLTALENLSIRRFEQLRSLHSLQCLLSLRCLTVGKCTQLVLSLSSQPEGEHMKHLPWFHTLCIDHTSLLKVGVVKASMTCLRSLQISHSPQLTLFTESEEQDVLQNLTSLQILCISNCAKLQCLPAQIQTLPSLKRLSIMHCPEIKSLPEDGLPASLKFFNISGCPKLSKHCRKEGGADWPKIAHIGYMSI